jgi:hypothetical protein
MYARHAERFQGRRDLGTEREVLPLRALRPANRRAIDCYVARDADLNRDQPLVGRQPRELGAQLAIERREARIRCGSAEVGRNAVSPQFATSEGCCIELESVQVEAYAEDTPRLAVKVDRTCRSTGARAANRVKLHDDSSCSELTNEVCHRGNAEAAAESNVMAATGSVVAQVAENLGQISLP